MKPLYEISNEYLSLYNATEEQTEEELIQNLQMIQEDFDKKALNIASFIKNLKLDLASVEQVQSDLDAKKKSISNKIKYLSEYLKFNIEKLGIDKISNSLHEVKIALNPVSVNVLDSNQIPESYKIHQDIVKPDLNKIKNDLKMGIVIDGVELKQDTRVIIK